jgi:hypothetical protein
MPIVIVPRQFQYGHELEEQYREAGMKLFPFIDSELLVAKEQLNSLGELSESDKFQQE